MPYTFTNEQRSDVRSLIRRQPGFEAFRLANGNFASREMTLDIIEKAIAHFGLAIEVDAIMSRHAARAQNGTAEAVEMVLGETMAKAAAAQWAREKADAEAEAEPEIAAMTAIADAEAEALAKELREDIAGGNRLPASAEITLADTVLDQLRPFVSDKLLATVSTALTPIVRDALKPAVERVVEIEVPAQGGTAIKLPARARKGTVSTFGKVFNAPRHPMAKAVIQLWDSAEAETPDPMFVVEPDLMSLLVTAAERGGSVWLAGPAGGGKSSMPQFYAAKAGRPFVCIAFNRAVETVDLIGQFVLDGNGGMVWRDGVLTQAIRRPGTVIMFDEIMFAPAGMLAILQTLMSSRTLTIHATGERVQVAEGVVFVAGDNSRGYGDETGLYAGVMQGNAALIDRMSRMVWVDYLPADLEAQALANHTGAPRPACDRVVAFIGGVRKLSGFENRPMSLRRMIAFVNATIDGYEPDMAFDVSMLSRLPDAEREALRQHIRGNFDQGAYKAEMSGKPVPAAPSNAAPQVGARNAFDPVP